MAEAEASTRRYYHVGFSLTSSTTTVWAVFWDLISWSLYSSELR